MVGAPTISTARRHYAFCLAPKRTPQRPLPQLQAINCSLRTTSRKSEARDICPGSVWFRVPKVAPGFFTPPPVVGCLGRTYGVGNSVVYYGESIRLTVGDCATQKLAQKNALRWRPVLQIAKDAPKIRSRKPQRIAFRPSHQLRQVKATCFVMLCHLHHTILATAACSPAAVSCNSQICRLAPRTLHQVRKHSNAPQVNWRWTAGEFPSILNQ
jgi:hypothetical protein